jgi:putative multiple sugar transport system ATP-binding protein
VAWNEIHTRARELLAGMGHPIDPTRPVGELGITEQQLLEIARTLAMDARLIIMDELTAPLPEPKQRGSFTRFPDCARAA